MIKTYTAAKHHSQKNQLQFGGREESESSHTCNLLSF